jgi:hypothetical protein
MASVFTARAAPPWGAAPRLTPLSPAGLAKGLLHGGLSLLRASTATLSRLSPDGGAATDLCELGEKLYVFERFQFALGDLGLDAAALPPLSTAVDRAGRLDVYSSLWTTEGLGHAYTVASLAGTAPPSLLTNAGRLPERALLPLHTGMGMALAARALAGGAGGLRGFLDLCRTGSLPGYAEATFEPLGFVARNLHSAAVPEIDRQLTRLAPELVGTFWHGVGRGLYFSPRHALPGATAAALADAWREPPHEEGRRNAASGLAWALTLVNIRHPEVLQGFLARHSLPPPLAQASADGSLGATVIWRHWTGAEAQPGRRLGELFHWHGGRAR